MGYDAFFRDAVTGTGRWDLDRIIYRSPAGNLLEVAHDLAALRQQPAAVWKGLWDARLIHPAHPFTSGVWARKELVLPACPLEHVVSLGEGNSPLQPAGLYGQDLGLDHLFIKQCGTTHTGSFKDLGMTVLVSQVNHLVRSGKQPRLMGVACASTGDTSAALAAYCAAAGLPAVVLLPAGKISPAQMLQPIAHGALTLALDTDFDGCMRLVQRLTEDDRIYLANSMNSLRIEGQKTVGMEVVQQLGWRVPDWMVIPGGNLGNVSALCKGFEEMLALGLVDRVPRILCCQAEAANPLYLAYRSGWREFHPVTAGPTQASAIRIGDPVSRPKAVACLQRHGGVVEQASEQELADECARADRRGLFCCPHTGVALAGLRKLVLRGEVARQDLVVVVSTAHGLKFTNVKADYHAGQLTGVEATCANRPVSLPATVDAVIAAVARKFETLRR